MAPVHRMDTDPHISLCQSCPKCGVDTGRASVPRSMRDEYLFSMCEPCKRIEAWIPEIAKAIAEILNADR